MPALPQCDLQCDVDDLIERALETVRHQGRIKDILFARTTGCEGLCVMAGPVHAVQLIAEALLEAVRRSPYRGIVTLDVHHLDQDIQLSIIDQGATTTNGGATCTITFSTPHPHP